VNVQGRPGFGNVKWTPRGAGGDITGSQASPGKTRAAHGQVGRAGGVEVALLRRQNGTCAWLRSTRGDFAPASEGACSHPVFLAAQGSGRWDPHLRRRPSRGAAFVLLRTRTGPPPAAFSPAQHDMFRVTIG
jgi:hypothetical protein